jgi:RND family efflux transporter MFP subunit
MSTEATNQAERSAEVPSRGRGFPIGWLVAALVVAGLVWWFGMRVKAATNTQAALAAERDQSAKEAAHAPAQGRPAAIAATTLTGVAQTWQPEISLDGTLQPSRETDLGFKAAGRLAAIRVKLGDRVSSGSVLATLEDNEAAAQVKAVEAQVRAAEAQLALAEDSAKRTTSLLGTGAATQANGVQVEQQRSLAVAQLDGARAQLSLAQANLKNHVLTSPFSGSVTKVPAGPGAIVSPGVPLFHVQDTSTLKLSGTIGEADARLVHAGATVELRLDGRVIQGKVTAVLSSVDASTRRVPVEAEVKNDATVPLLGGSFVRAAVVGLPPTPVVKLPATTLRPGSQDEIMVVKDGRVSARRIAFALAGDGALLVRAGVRADEAVLASPSAEAQEGDKVR